MNVGDLGQYIREQRRTAEISLRQLARLAGVSNPYLSQIERGLRQPSAEILQQIARGLRISAEALYVQAGILDERRTDSQLPEAVLQDLALNERQKQVLLEIYESFRRENDLQRGQSSAPVPALAAIPDPADAGEAAIPDRADALEAAISDPKDGAKPAERQTRPSPRAAEG